MSDTDEHAHDDEDIEQWLDQLAAFADDHDIPLHSVHFYREADVDHEVRRWPCCDYVEDPGELLPIHDEGVTCPSCGKRVSTDEHTTFDTEHRTETERYRSPELPITS
jgi:hypothetical protein